MTVLWQGPTCPMCNGTGVRPWFLGSDHYVRCPNCNGHGREATS